MILIFYHTVNRKPWNCKSDCIYWDDTFCQWEYFVDNYLNHIFYIVNELIDAEFWHLIWNFVFVNLNAVWYVSMILYSVTRQRTECFVWTVRNEEKRLWKMCGFQIFSLPKMLRIQIMCSNMQDKYVFVFKKQKHEFE